MGINVGLGKHEPYLALGGKIRPTEVDRVEQYTYLKVGGATDAIMAACALGSVTSATGTITLGYPDYPRNLLVTFTETGGTVAKATATVTGKDQFGKVISEEYACVELGTVSVAGTKFLTKLQQFQQWSVHMELAQLTVKLVMLSAEELLNWGYLPKLVKQPMLSE